MGDNTDRFKRLSSKGEPLVGNDSDDRMPAVRPNDLLTMLYEANRILTKKVDALMSKLTQMEGWLEAGSESRARDREDTRKDIDELKVEVRQQKETNGRQDVTIAQMQTKIAIYALLASGAASTAVGLVLHFLK